MRLLYFIPAFVGCAAMLAGCDKNDKTPESLSEKTYFGMTELEVNYNGSGMSGKRASLKPSGNSAAITFDGAFAPSTLSEKLKGLPEIATAGVLPGSPQLTLAVDLKADGDRWSFSGAGETDFVTYSYSGTSTPELMTLDLSDVKLKDQRLAGGVWAPKKGDGDPLSADQGFHIVWELGLPLPVPSLEIGLQELLRVLVNYPFIPAYNNTASMSLTQVLVNGLRTLAFTPDGNLVATYLQTANGASTFTHAPLTMMQYVPLSDSQLKLFVNPTDILSLILLNNDKHDPNIPENPWGAPSRADSDTPTTPSIDYTKLITALYKGAEMVAAGIPMECPHTNTGMQLYIGTETLLPVMQGVLLPVLTDPGVQSMIMAYVQSNPTLASHAEEIRLALDAIELIIAQTDKIEFGLNLDAAK